MKKDQSTHFWPILIVLVIGAVQPMTGQRLNLPQGFEQFSNADGLSQGMINVIFQDSRGFLWLGTKDGLNRYDGYQFKVYRHDPFDSTTISNNFIHAVVEDDCGYLWIGTEGGLNRFDPEQETFLSLSPGTPGENSLPDGPITAICVDSRNRQSAGKALWCGSSAGIYRIEPLAEACADSYRVKHFPGPDEFLSDLVFDRLGRLWIAAYSQLYWVENAAGEQEELVLHAVPSIQEDPGGLPSVNYCELRLSEEGDLWIGSDKALSLLPAERAAELAFQNFPLEIPVARNGIRDLDFDRKGRLWLVHNSGTILTFDPATGDYLSTTRIFEDRSESAVPVLIRLLVDRTDNVWIGTAGFGLLKYNLRKEQFHPVTRSLAPAPTPTTSYVADIQPSPDGGVLVNMGRFFHFDPGKQELQDPGYFFTGDLTYEFHVLPSGSFFLHHKPSKSYALYDPESRTTTSIRKSPVDRAIEFPSVLSDDKGDLYFLESTLFGRENERSVVFSHWEKATQQISEMTVPAINDMALSRAFEQGLFDREGRIWYPNNDALLCIDPHKMEARIFLHDPSDPQSLNINHIKSVCLDPLQPDRYLWVGTNGGGINRMDMSAGTFRYYTEKDGLSNSVVYGILPDGQGNLWLSTNQGLSKLVLNAAREVVTFRNYGVDDGLPGAEFNTGAYYRNERGELFFGGVDGFVWFHPDSLGRTGMPPPVVVTDFQVNYRSVSHRDPGSPLQRSITTTGSIVLSHQENSIAFEFAALDFSSPARNQYTYLLENFDEDWNAPTGERRAVYTNLDPGRYVFRVKASNGDGVWNEEGVRIELLIRPPWWRTCWAYLGYALVALVTYWWARRVNRERRRLKEEAAVERARAEEKQQYAEKLETQARELEAAFAELKAKNDEILTAHQQLIVQDKLATLGQLIAGIAHEIKNPLNFVTNFSEITVELADELQEELGKFQSQIATGDFERLLELISDIRQNAADIESNGLRAVSIIHSMMDHTRGTEDEARSVDVNALLDENVKLAYHGHRALDPAFQLTIHKEYDQSLPVISAVSAELGRVLLNLLNNACYAVQQKQKALGNGYLPTLTVSTGHSSEWIEIHIRDNGPGIPAEVRDRIFQPFFTTKPSGEGHTGLGLAISRELIEEKHRGQLEVASEPGEYTEFVIRLPVG